MAKQKTFDCLTDEEVLKEFVKRFECDGAILIYLDSNGEFGFGEWRNALGKKWVKNVINVVKKDPLTVKDGKYLEQNSASNYCQV